MHKAGGVLANILPPCVGLTRFGLGGNFTKRSPGVSTKLLARFAKNRPESSKGQSAKSLLTDCF